MERIYSDLPNIVLAPLEGNTPAQPGALQTFIHARYENIELFYWILFVGTLVVLIYVHIAKPLYERFMKK